MAASPNGWVAGAAGARAARSRSRKNCWTLLLLIYPFIGMARFFVNTRRTGPEFHSHHLAGDSVKIGSPRTTAAQLST
jgi:hypothetical protein